MSIWSDITGMLFQKQGIWEIQPRLFILSAIREPEVVKAAGINYVVDLEGRIDSRVSDFLTAYRYWPIKDEPQIPDEHQLFLVACETYHWWTAGFTVGIH